MSDPLVERAAAGDVDAFTTLLRDHDDRMRAVAYRLLGSQGAMDDALQTAYLKAFRSIGSLRHTGGFGPWLRRIVVNCCHDLHRQQGRRGEVPLEVAEQLPVAGDHDEAGERLARRDQLVAALATLPLEQRAVVILVDGEGLSYAEVAAALGIEPGTVGSRLSRGRAALRRHLGPAEGSDR